VKRFKETLRRPWKIWFMDVSKQIMSAFTIHSLNLMISFFLSDELTADECVWYFLNLTIDTVLGTFISYFLLLLFNKFASKFNWTNFKSGLYYEKVITDEKVEYVMNPIMYLSQLFSWALIVMVVKIFILIKKYSLNQFYS
jgi:hypothetical protein